MIPQVLDQAECASRNGSIDKLAHYNQQNDNQGGVDKKFSYSHDRQIECFGLPADQIQHIEQKHS